MLNILDNNSDVVFILVSKFSWVEPINIHVLTKQPIRPICRECHKNPARSNGVSSLGFQLWHKLCSVCAKKKYTKPVEKKSNCDLCGFVASDPCQLDLVDDKTICANCHRLIMKQQNNRRRAERQITVDATVDLNQIIQ
jgi:hypothetical protein